MKIELKPLDIDITKIEIEQIFGYQTTYWKVAPIKHKRKLIDGIWYNTKKADLVWYRKKYVHSNNFNLQFIYKQDETFFMRSFTSMGEIFELTHKSLLITLLQDKQTLF